MKNLKETVCHEIVISISLNSSIHRLVDKKMDSKPRFDVETPGANILKVALCFHFQRASLCPCFSCCFFFFLNSKLCFPSSSLSHFILFNTEALAPIMYTQAEKGAVSMQLKLSACVVLVPVQASAPFSPACIAAESDVQPRGKLISYCADLLFNLLSTSLVQ